MPKRKKAEVTLDDLAVMVKYGFDGVDNRFNEVDKRFNEVDKRFDKMDKRFDRIEHLMLSEHKQRIEHLEREVQKIKDIFAVR